MINFIIPKKINKELEAKLLAAAKLVNDLIPTNAFRLALVNSEIDLHQGFPEAKVVAEVKTNLDAYHFINRTNVTIKLDTYYSFFTKAVAYYKNGTIYFNRRKTGLWSAKDYASNMLHEATHAMGFDHVFPDIPIRKKSLPYTMNRIIEELAI